jgi:hypothetical protein
MEELYIKEAAALEKKAVFPASGNNLHAFGARNCIL